MTSKKTTPTSTPSTSAPRKKRAAASKGRSTSGRKGASTTLSSGSTPFQPVDIHSLGDVQDWARWAMEKGASTILAVTGSDQTNLTARLPVEGKRQQSLPPGDLLVVVLPPGVRSPGVALIRPAGG